jgi:hypothetical protein
MTIRRQIVDWKGLKALGWPYCRAHTWRLMAGGWEDATGKWVVNTDPFPKCVKLGHKVNGHPVWQMSAIREYFKAPGLELTEID